MPATRKWRSSPLAPSLFGRTLSCGLLLLTGPLGALADQPSPPAPAEPSLFESSAEQKPLSAVKAANSAATDANANAGAEAAAADRQPKTAPAALNQPTPAAADSSRRKSTDPPAKPVEKSVSDVGSSAGDRAPPAALGDVRPSSFQGVTPGETTVAQLREQLGPPQREAREGEVTTFNYQVGPFDDVRFTAAGGLVHSIVIGLQDHVEAKSIEAELQLTELRPAPIYDENGKLLGAAYPERGVVFGYVVDDRPPGESPTVEQIILDPISAEPFVLRAEHQSQRRYEQNLADLLTAVRIQPDNDRAHWRRAELLTALQHYEQAEQALEQALRLAPQNPRYQLTRVRLLRESGDSQQALAAAASISADSASEPLVRALAELEQGDVLASAHLRDFRAALDRHLAAIKLAAPLGNDAQFARRRLAKRILVDAHLAAALDIAAGNWQAKEKAAAQWLDNGRKLAQGMLEHEQADPLLMLAVSRKILQTYAVLGGDPQATAVAGQAIHHSQKLLGESDDALYQQHVQWELAAALLAAAQAEHARQQFDSARQFAEHAAQTVEPLIAADTSSHRVLLHARCCFMAGAARVGADKNYDSAAAWYAKAAPILIQHSEDLSDFDAAADGQKLVSMGVALWRSGENEQARQWTRHGVAQLERGVEAGQIDKFLLAVPYNNLAAMNESLGDSTAAAALAAKAKSLQVAADQRR